MKCKFCEAELNPGESVCPACGKDNAKEKAPMTINKLIALIVAGVVLFAVVAGVGIDRLRSHSVKYSVNYTAEQGKLDRYNDKVVATMGEYELTNGMLQIYYWNQVYGFAEYFSDYAEDLNFFEAFHTQTNPDSNLTWQQHFLKMAIETWQRDQAMAKSFDESGMTLPEDLQLLLDNMDDNLAADAVANGFASALEMIQYDMGPGVTLEDYKAYGELYYKSFTYFSELEADITVSDEEKMTYYEENKDIFDEKGIDLETRFVTVRHCLIRPDGGSTNSFSGEVTYTDEEWEAGLEKAEKLYAQWKTGDMTEESFHEFAIEHSEDPGSASAGGLYEKVGKGTMVPEFDDWIFDESRQHGDHDLIRTSYGYHIMFYVGDMAAWDGYANSGVIAEKQTALYEEAQEANPIEIDYSNVALGLAEWHRAELG